MKLQVTVVLTLALWVMLASSQQNGGGGGLFSRLREYLRPRRQSIFRRPQPPPPQQPFRQPAQRFRPNFNNPPPPKFNSINSNPPNAFNAPQNFNQPQNTFNQPQNFNPPQNNFNQPQNNFNQPQTTFSNSFKQQQSSFVSGPTNIELSDDIPAQSSNFRNCHTPEPAPFCPKSEPNHFFEGKSYLLTFNIDCSSGCLCRNFTGQEADNYCRSMGARAVSLDTPSKVQHFRGVSAQFAQRYFWTGGRMNYPDQSYTWPSGVTVRIGENKDPWSHTGGWDRPQPDNRNQLRDNCEPELCIGVLNNFYADGIVWHDVACHHKKPTICEWP